MVFSRGEPGTLKMPVADGPDFLCIGMHKSGTQWLYDQVQGHPDFWMPPLKEIHYLDRGEEAGRSAQKVLDQERSTSRPGSTRQSAITDPRDRAFLEEMASHLGKPLDLDRYASLFRHKGDLLSGDITPQYGELDEGIVANVAGRFPRVTVFLLIRDPVSRAWSHISQWHRQGRFDRSKARVLQDENKFRHFLARSKKLQRFSSATRVAERWTRHVGLDRFRHIFFDDIANRPDAARRDILLTLGADPVKSSGEIDPDFNRKSHHQKLDFSSGMEAVLADFLKDELQRSAAMFGGHAKDWAAKYGF